MFSLSYSRFKYYAAEIQWHVSNSSQASLGRAGVAAFCYYQELWRDIWTGHTDKENTQTNDSSCLRLKIMWTKWTNLCRNVSMLLGLFASPNKRPCWLTNFSWELIYVPLWIKVSVLPVWPEYLNKNSPYFCHISPFFTIQYYKTRNKHVSYWLALIFLHLTEVDGADGATVKLHIRWIHLLPLNTNW